MNTRVPLVPLFVFLVVFVLFSCIPSVAHPMSECSSEVAQRKSAGTGIIL
jgi:hypothetical protein